MNVLSDILCGSSSLILSSSYNGPLSSHDTQLAKPISKQNLMLSNDKDFHLLETLSNTIPNLVPTPNTSVVENGFFDAPESIHVSLNLVNSNYPMQQETGGTDFVNSELSNSIPSWFSKEDNVAVELLPTVRSENLPMLQLEFPQDINVQNNSGSMNSGYMPNNQALLSESHVFSSADSLLSTFNDIGNYPLPVSKANRTCNKFEQNHVASFSTGSAHNVMNNILPLDNHLDIHPQDQIHLSLPNSIVDTHSLTNANSASTIITDNQSNIHSLESLRDKRSNISLNQLDFLLDSHSPLNDMQITSNSFSVGPISSDKQICSNFTRDTAVGNCNGNLTAMSCSNGSLSNLSIQPFNEPQEIVAMNNLSHLTIDPVINTILDPIDEAIDEIKCLKCKYCTFLSLNKEQVRNHIRETHTKVSNLSQTSTHNVLYPSSIIPVENYSNTDLSNINDIAIDQNPRNACGGNFTKKFNCNFCISTFNDAESLAAHSLTIHGDRSKSSINVTNKMSYSTVNSIPQVDKIPDNLPGMCEQQNNTYKSTIAPGINKNSDYRSILPNNQSREKPNTNKNSPKNLNKKQIDSEEINSQKRASVHKKAWQKKIKRELSSYICESKGCNIRFHYLDNLEYHKKCHIAGTGKFSCPECTMIFDHWGPTAGHLWRNHFTDMELHACDICPFRTYSLSRLEIHHKPLHQNKFPFQCDICKKKFKINKQLLTHKAIHFKPATLPRKFACFICSRQFTSKKTLRTHLLVHNKQKSFVCNVCDYSALKRSTLKMHALQHTGEKPFKCKDCDYQTADHNTFRRHKMKHSGEKPYKCPFCPYVSIQATTYKSHIKRQHPGQEHHVMFSCNICSFRSVKQDNYIAHMADHEIEKVSRQDTSNNRLVSDSPRQQDSEVLPLVAAMDISLFHGDQSMMMPLTKENNSYLRQFSANDLLQ